MVWHSMNYSDGLQYELDAPDAAAKCKVIQLASGDWQGRLEWLKKGGKRRVQYTDPYKSDVDAIAAIEKLLTKLELEIEGASVVDNQETPHVEETFDRFTVLEKARTALHRGAQTHGAPESSFVEIAQAWTYYLGEEIKPSQAATMMALFKVARQKQRPNQDNFVDAIGYLALAAELSEKEELPF